MLKLAICISGSLRSFEYCKESFVNHIIKSNEKYFIVISGDYGVWGDRTYCKSIDNKLFIANGIGDNPNDTIIKIFDYNKGFAIQELKLNKVD